MKRVFAAAGREEANRRADEWCVRQPGLRAVHRTEMAIGETGPSLGNASNWALAVHYEAESSN
jgi:hypothetical protein